MLHTISTQNMSSESTFAWVKELLARGQHEIISIDEPAGQIETRHALFHVIERNAAPDLGMLTSSFSESLNKNKNFAILAPNLTAEAAQAVAERCDPVDAARYHRRDVLSTKVVIATTEPTIERAVDELTQVNKALQALGKIYAFQDKHSLFFALVAVSGIIEQHVHAPELLYVPTFLLVLTVGVSQFIVWIAGRRRISAARRQRKMQDV